MNQKDRRNSGRYYDRLNIKDTKQFILDNCIEPQQYWDDWKDFRDGLRGYLDKTRIFPNSIWTYNRWDCNKLNKKNKLLLKRRIMMRLKRRGR